MKESWLDMSHEEWMQHLKFVEALLARHEREINPEEDEKMSLHLSEKVKFEPAPEGEHPARCIIVADIGRQETFYGEKDQVVLSWELPYQLSEEGAPFTVVNTYTASLHRQAALRADLDAWRGQAFTREELRLFDLKNVLSKPCFLTIAHKVRPDDSVSCIVKSIRHMPAEDARQLPAAINRPVAFDVDVDAENFEKLRRLPRWVQKKILDRLSPPGTYSQDSGITYSATAALPQQALPATETDGLAPAHVIGTADSVATPVASDTPPADNGAKDFDDDIPF